MKAIILAAGLSSRLFPLTSELPKCLLPVDGKGIIEHQIDWLNACGVYDILVVTGFQAEKIVSTLGSRARYHYYPEFAETNNLYTLHSIRHELDQDFILLFADVLLDQELLGQCITSQLDYCLIVEQDQISETTMFVKLENNLVVDIGSHIPMQEADGNFIGIAKYSEKAALEIGRELDKIVATQSCRQDYYTKVLVNIAAKKQPIQFIPTNGRLWVEIDTNEEYQAVLLTGLE